MEVIGNALSGERLELALLQDYVMEIIYNSIEPGALLYGGTAIWRCYGGMRFSEDIDIYMKSASIEKLIKNLPAYDLTLESRDKDLQTIVRVSNGKTSLLIEAKEGNAESTIMPYVKVDGSTMAIGVLTPAELLMRKIEAYSNRKYMRDLYDIYVLTGRLDSKDYFVRSKLLEFIKTINKPADEKVLKSLVYAGKAISYREFIDYIKKWLG